MLAEPIVDFFFPKRCLSCGRSGSFVCESCLEKVPWLESQFCPVCLKPSVSGFTHLRCQNSLTPDRFICPLAYKGLVSSLIQSVKYGGVTSLVPYAVSLTKEFMEESLSGIGAEAGLTYVPLHPLKLMERGFNQSLILAKSLGELLRLEVFDLLIKAKETKSQTTFSREERKSNVRGTFKANAVEIQRIKNRDLILVDDVFTTGATLLECSRILKLAGARFIYLFTLAKD
ncbi:MAG: ComF family protein [Patescibacteria group bacterium]|nr:ComF family protein [Patescibacteria group bacterium]